MIFHKKVSEPFLSGNQIKVSQTLALGNQKNFIMHIHSLKYVQSLVLIK